MASAMPLKSFEKRMGMAEDRLFFLAP